jgi:hypothetical protein
MTKCIIPERRNINDNYDNFWKRIKSNGAMEYYSKEYFNPDYTRKITSNDIIEDIKKELLLVEINALY